MVGPLQITAHLPIPHAQDTCTVLQLIVYYMRLDFRNFTKRVWK